MKTPILNSGTQRLVAFDYIVIFAIVLSSFLIYLHHLVPDTNVWDTLLFRFSPKAASNVQGFIYSVLLKLTPLIICSVWFITEVKWWRWSLILPISLLLHQLLRNLALNFNGDKMPILLEVLIVIVICMLLIFIKRKLNYFHRNLGSKYNIDSENLLLIPSASENLSRLNNVKLIIDKESLNRKQLNTIYNEFEYLKRFNNLLEVNERRVSDRPFYLKLILEVLIFISVVSMPFLFILHKIATPGQTLLDLFYFISIPSFGFPDVYTFLWVFSSKVGLILAVSLWFFTNRHWWKYFLLIPFVVGLFQLFELFKEYPQIDTYEFFTVIPFILLLMTAMVLITRRIRNFVLLSEFYSKMEDKINSSIKELSQGSEQEERNQLKTELTNLIKEHKSYSPEEYLARLKEIKERVEQLKEKA